MSLSREITDALETLHYASASVQAVMNSSASDNRFSRAMEALDRLAHEKQIPIAIVGGLAAIRYGYPAVTEDIDIAIARDQIPEFVIAAPTYGFEIAWRAESDWHTLTHGDVEINVVPEGGKAQDSSPTTIPSPAELGVAEGLDYANLAGWMELKISSGRRKDQTHVIEVLKKCSEAAIDSIRDHLRRVHDTYLQKLNELAEEAELERQQEARRRPPQH